jgi:xanthine dehydrogenase large subunit
MVQVAATLFSISEEKIKIEATNTSRVANTSPSAASSTADLNGKALENAAIKIIKRLKIKAGLMLKQPEDQIIIKDGIVGVMNSDAELDTDQKTLEWNELIIQSYLSRIDLSAHGFYQTPGINFDSSVEKGHPFAYYSFGVCQSEVTLDTLKGTFIVDTVNVVHDVGKVMNRALDLGQLEGGIVQGLGWTLMEELKYLPDGRLASNTFSAYKIPDISFTPEMNIEMFEHDDNPLGIFRSKAIGEPPLFYGISALFALKNAISAFNPGTSPYRLPLTPEGALMDLYRSDNN